MKKLICAFLVTMLLLGVSVAAAATSDPTSDPLAPSETITEPVTTEPSGSEPEITEPSIPEPVVPGTVTCTPGGTCLPGQAVTVTVSVSGSQPARAIRYSLSFDSTLFVLDSVTCLSPGSWELDGTIFLGSEPVEINGDLLTLTLRVLETTQPGTYEVSCSLIAIADTEIAMQTLAAAPVVIECPHVFVQDPLVEGALLSPASCAQPALYYQSCSLCGYVDTVSMPFEFGEMLPHVFDAQKIAPEYLKDPGTCSREQAYFLSCSACGLCSPNVETDFFLASNYFGDHVYDNDCDEYCNECGRFQQAKHIAGTEWFSNGEEHWHKCITCSINMDYQRHQPGPMSAGDKTQVCTVCQYELDDGQDQHICSYDGQWHSNDGNHWRECECGKQANMGAHQWDAGATVTQPTADKEGLVIYTCTVCQHERKQYIPATGEPDSPTDYPSLPTTPIQPVVVEQESGPNWPAIILGILLAISLIANGVLVFFLYQITHRRPQRSRKV